VVPHDFNGDGKSDIVWRNNTNGGNVMWLMNGATIASSLGVGNVPTNWVVAGIGDSTATAWPTFSGATTRAAASPGS
jgi:hypothetical protein